MHAVLNRLLENVPNDIKAAKKLGLLHFASGNAAETRKMASLIAKHQKDSPDAEMLFGLAHYLSEEYREAFVQLQKSATKNINLTSVYFLGLTHFKLGEFELALTQFQRCLDISPTSAQPRIMLAMTYLRQGRTEEAELETQRVLDKDPTNAVAYNILGSSLLSSGRFEEGLEALSVATQLNPNLADAHFKKGLYSLKQGGMDEDAEKDLSLALELAPEALNTRLVLATQYMRRKDFPKALDTLKEGLNGTQNDAVIHSIMAQAYFKQQNVDAAVSELIEAKKIRPGLLGPYYTLAAYYMTKGDHKLALNEYEAMLAIAPENINALLSAGQAARLSEDTSKADKYLRKAAYTGIKTEYRAYLSFLVNQGKRDDALMVLDDIIKKDLQSYLPLEDKGRLLLSMGEHVQALAAFRELMGVAPQIGVRHTVATLLQMGENKKALTLAKEVAQTNPENHMGYLLIARVHQVESDFSKSLEVLRSALGKVTDQRPVRMAMGSIYESMNNIGEARANFEVLLKDHPAYVPGLSALGSLENRMGEYGKAEALYKAILELEPKNTFALNNLAYLYVNNYDNIEGAFPLAINAYKNDPTNPGIIETLGYVLYKQGQLEQAGQLLTEAKKLLPNNPTVNYHLALVYNESDRSKQAAELLKAALQMGAFPERARAEKLLNNVTD
jgi:tetratricopeptide (TPR) repeat protein